MSGNINKTENLKTHSDLSKVMFIDFALWWKEFSEWNQVENCSRNDPSSLWCFSCSASKILVLKLAKLTKCYACRYPSNIGGHNIDGYFCLPLEWISTTHAISVWRNGVKSILLTVLYIDGVLWSLYGEGKMVNAPQFLGITNVLYVKCLKLETL